MKRSFKAVFLTVCMTALATAPIVTVTTLATADAAYAKPGKSGADKGPGNSKAGKAKGKDRSAKAKSKGGKPKFKSKGQGGGKGKKNTFYLSDTKGGKKIKNFFEKITGQDKKSTRTVTARAYTSPETLPEEIEPPIHRGRQYINGMHRSELGNMNASYNASFNAVLAHIRNHNTNGPVGLVAALSVLEADSKDARDTVNLEQDYQDLEDALAKAGFDDPDLDTALDDYLASGETDPHVKYALDELHYDSENDTFPKPRPDPETELEPAELEIHELEEEKRELVSQTWNKSEEASEEDLNNVVEVINARIFANIDDIHEAVDESKEHDDDDDDDDKDDDDDVVCQALECPEIEEYAAAQ